MNIAIYARVSSERQAKEGTIQSQLEALRGYAKENEHQIVDEFIDDGYSGADLNRPGLDDLRDAARDGLLEGVLVLSPDRLSRKQAHQIILLEEFKKLDTRVIFSTQPFGNSAEDQLLLNIQGAISEYERAKILDRSRRGELHAIRNGQVKAGNPPYGYKYVPKSRGRSGSYALDEQEAEIVKTIFDYYINARLPGTAIARRLQSDGLPSRSPLNKWWSSTIYQILKNETYTGTAYMYKTKSVEPNKHPKVKRYRHRRKSGKVDRPREQWIPVSVPAIIDYETWQKAQDLLKVNARRSRRNNKKNSYLLRGLVICGHCGSMAPGYVSNKHTYYSCGAKRNKNMTTKAHEERVAVSHKALDEKVWQGLVALLDDPEKLKAQAKDNAARRKHSKRTESSSQRNTQQLLNKLAIEEERLLVAYREGVIDLDVLREQKGTISKRIRALHTRQKATTNSQEGSGRTEISLTDIKDLSAIYKRAMYKADFVTKEKIANLLINRVKLFPEKAIIEGVIPIDKDALNRSHQSAPFFKVWPKFRS